MYLGWRETQLTSMKSGMNSWPCGVYGKVASRTVSIGFPSEREYFTPRDCGIHATS